MVYDPRIFNPNLTAADVGMQPKAAPQVQTGGTEFQPSNLIETQKIDLAPIVAEAKQIASTGAQGNATPSYSREAAERSTAVSRILEKQLGGLAQPGFGDIISAALQTIQKPGQVDFVSALRQGQAQDINRAYNIANALSGLQRKNAQQEIGPRDMLRIVQEQAARGDRRFTSLLTNIDRAASDFEDPVAAREKLMEGVQKFDADNKTPVQVMGEAVSFARESGLAPKQPRQTSRQDTGISEAIELDEQSGLYLNRAGGRVLPWMVNYNALVKAGRLEEARALQERTLTGARPESSAKVVTDFENQLAGADVAFQLMGRIDQAIAERGASIMGAAGSLSQILQGGISQASAIAGIDLSQTPDRLATEFNQRFTANPELNARTKASFSWLDRDNSPAAQAFKSNMLILGPTIAKSLDPAGRLSNQDVQQALQIIGNTGAGLLTDPRAVQRALQEVRAFISDTLEARRSRITPIRNRYPDPVQIRGTQQTAPAPAPTVSPAAPAVADPLEGRKARDAAGNRVIRRNGRWEPFNE